METAKLFQNGSSQAARLPKAFRIPGNEVRIFKKGKQVILEPIETTWDSLFELQYGIEKSQYRQRSEDARFILGIFNYIRPGVVFLCLLTGQHFQVVVQCFYTAVEPFPIMFCFVR